jgi:succinate dehydrogenase/fumarate reductase flavoprotein subunit
MSIVEPPVSAADVPSWDRTAEFVVIGLGIAGSAAALEAQELGIDVLVIERASGGGGASALSQGIFYFGGGTALQKAVGYDESVDNYRAFMEAIITSPDTEKLDAYIDESIEAFDWLEAQGVPFKREAYKEKAVYIRSGEGLLSTCNEKVWPFRDIAKPVMRGHQVSGQGEISGGSVAMNAVLATVKERAVPVIYDAAVTALVIDGDRIVGVKMRKEGADLFVQATSGVMIAAGSFNLNAEITMKHMPTFATYGKPLGTPQNDGAGLLLGESVGGAERGMHGTVPTASIYPPPQLIKGIIVNSNGERFVTEDAYHGRTAVYTEKQPGHKAFLILDEESFDYPKHGSHIFMDAYESVQEMAAAMGVPPEVLQRTLDDYNTDAENGEDTQFHKHPDWIKVLEPPYAVFDLSIPTSDYHWMSLGGLWTDADSRVLRDDGSAISGLYAAGACTSHLSQDGDEYGSGMSLAGGVIFGRRASRAVAASRS